MRPREGRKTSAVQQHAVIHRNGGLMPSRMRSLLGEILDCSWTCDYQAVRRLRDLSG
jgi:hypothetical protein